MYLLKKIIVIIIGSIFLSLGINLFLAPHEILDGGIVGLSLILNYLYDLEVGLMIMLLSVPIFIVAWVRYRHYFYNSLHGLLFSSFIIDFLKPLRSLVHLNPIPSSIIGGVCIGTGMGLMLRFHTSTGGTDLIAQFLSVKSGINVGIIIFMIDVTVIILGGVLISANTLFLSIITLMVVGMTTSLVTKKISHA